MSYTDVDTSEGWGHLGAKVPRDARSLISVRYRTANGCLSINSFDVQSLVRPEGLVRVLYNYAAATLRTPRRRRFFAYRDELNILQSPYHELPKKYYSQIGTSDIDEDAAPRDEHPFAGGAGRV